MNEKLPKTEHFAVYFLSETALKHYLGPDFDFIYTKLEKT